MKSLSHIVALIGTALLPGVCACAAETPTTGSEAEAWNAGVDAYRAGDFTNAMAKIRPLMLSRSREMRAAAAEVVAKLAYDQSDRELSAEAALIALREASKDDRDRAGRNFTRAVDGLAERREQAHIDEVIKASQGKDPGAMLQAATYDARALMKGCAEQSTNEPFRAVALADQYARRAEKIADTWIPVRQLIIQSVTNEEQAATIVQQVEDARAKSGRAATSLGDIDDGAYALLGDVEHDLTRFMKLTVMPPAAMDECEKSQTNSWLGTEAFNGRDWQQDALDYTRAFRDKFPSWAKAYEQQAQADTNKPPFTAEDQAKISALATELEKLQLGCLEKRDSIKQQEALRCIRDIKSLLPKDKNGGGQNQQNQQQNQQNQQQNQQNQQQQNQQQNQQQDQQQNQQQDQQQEDPQQEDPQQEDESAEESEDDRQNKDDEAILKKAQERSDEHEAERKARARKAPLPPNARDW